MYNLKDDEINNTQLFNDMKKKKSNNSGPDYIQIGEEEVILFRSDVRKLMNNLFVEEDFFILNQLAKRMDLSLVIQRSCC
jgi:hypothetical protein